MPETVAQSLQLLGAAHMNYPCRPLHEILRIAASEVPTVLRLHSWAAHLTYSQIKEAGGQICDRLARLGIKQSEPRRHHATELPAVRHCCLAILRLGRHGGERQPALHSA